MYGVKGWCLAVLMLVLVLPAGIALTVFPETTTLGENYHGQQQFVFSVLNDGPGVKYVSVSLASSSSYLKEYVEYEPKALIIEANERKNIRVNTNLPKDLSPELHRVDLVLVSEGKEEGTASFTFRPPGVAKPDLRLGSFGIKEERDGLVVLDILLNNEGNVIARAYPHVVIRNDTSVVRNVSYESQTMVMPFSTYNLTLLQDVSSLPPGSYEAAGHFRYNDGLKTATKEVMFSISEGGDVSEKGTIPYAFYGVIILVLLVFIIKPKYLKKSIGGITRKGPVGVLENRVGRLEKDVDGLVKEVHAFVREADTWVVERFGEQYRFK